MASFVRQLNMYGFHKVIALHSGNLKVGSVLLIIDIHIGLNGHIYGIGFCIKLITKNLTRFFHFTYGFSIPIIFIL